MQTEATKMYGFRLERTLPASAERVFAAWTDPRQLALWSAPEGLQIPRADIDVRVGGRWEVVMEPAAGGASHVAGGEYREVEGPRRLVFTHSWRTDRRSVETLVTVELEAFGEAARLTVVQEGFTDEWSRDGHEDGWRSCLDRLERLFR